MEASIELGHQKKDWIDQIWIKPTDDDNCFSVYAKWQYIESPGLCYEDTLLKENAMIALMDVASAHQPTGNKDERTTMKAAMEFILNGYEAKWR